MNNTKRMLASIAAVAAMASAVGTAEAGVVIDVTQVGPDVVFTATGSLDLSGAAPVDSYPSYGLGFIPQGPNWYVAPGPGGNTNSFALTGFAPSFGTSQDYFDSPISETGDDFFIWGDGGAQAQVGVSPTYVSGDSIDSTMTFAGSIASLDLTPGTYIYTLPDDTITLVIGGGGTGVPEPATLGLLGFGLFGSWLARRRTHSSK